MAPRKMREVLGAVKDQTSITLAKVSGSSSVSDLEVAIIKATRHGPNPPNQCYVAEILSLTSYSRAMVNSAIGTIGRRLSRTKNWVVALKSLLLVQRLLSQGGTAFEQEIFFATRRGTRFLNMCDFRDSSRRFWDYSAFIRTYALYLDELLEFRMQGHSERGGRDHAYSKAEVEEEAVVVRTTPVSQMDNDAAFSRADHLIQLLERFLACRPTGSAKNNRIVVVALYPILRESFEIYHCITEILGALIERFMQLDVPDMIQVHHIFSRVSKQYNELDCFYSWCKNVGILRLPDYPNVDKISEPKLEMMNDFIRHKSAMLHSRRSGISIDQNSAYVVDEEMWREPQKALSPIAEETVEEVNVTPVQQHDDKKPQTQEEGDLLNLYEDSPSSQDFGDKLALALFGGCPATTAPAGAITPWEAFKESESGDWETALVQSASHLSNQTPSLPQGFDPLILDGMYQQGTMAHTAASSGFYATGSASSMMLGSAGRPAILALPASPLANGGAVTFSPMADPFAASLAIAPPAYLQMSEMEAKQRLLVQEQLMWQQYTRNGMHGQVGLAQLQQQNSYQYIPGVHTAAW